MTSFLFRIGTLLTLAATIGLADVPEGNRDPARGKPRSEVRDQRHRKGDGNGHSTNMQWQTETEARAKDRVE